MLVTGLTLLLVFVTRYANGTNGPHVSPDDVTDSSSNFPEFDRISAVLEPLADRVRNEKCRTQLQRYVESLKNSSLWAVQMFDASAKVPQGLLTSDAYDLGNYDGCVEINLKRAEEDNIFGKYCLASVSLVKKDLYSEDSSDVFMEPGMSTWEKLMVPVFRYGFINNVFRTAVCVPNECTCRDVENVLGGLYSNITRIIGDEIQVRVPQHACSSKEIKENDAVYFIKRTILCLFLWVTISTIFDLLGWFRKPKASWIKILMTFSAYKNVRVLTSVNSPEHIPVVNSLKVYTFIILVITRRLSFFIMGPIVNRKAVDEVFSEAIRESVFSVSNNFIADTFLFLEGFSHYPKVYSYFRKFPRISIWRIYLLEYLKAVPQYGLAILFYGHILETVGSGPMWKERTGTSVKNCRENWLLNLLHLNNLVGKNKMCIFESWYFAVVAQCFVSIPIVVRIMIKSSTTGITILGLLTAGAFALPLAFSSGPRDLSQDDSSIQWHRRLEVGTIDRALPYLIGVFSSAIYTRLQEGKFKWKACSGIFYLSTAGLLLMSVTMHFSLNSEKTAVLELIHTFRQLIWSLILSGIVVGVSARKLPSLTPVFRQKYIFLLGRLFCPYLLVLGLVQLHTTGIARTLDYLSPLRLIWTSTADLLATWILAFVFHMIVHRPVSNILHEKILGVQEAKPKSQAKDHNFDTTKLQHFKCKKKSK